MKKIYFLAICLLFVTITNAQNKGNLFIIGGGDRSDALMQQMLNTASLKPNDYIIVLPMSSEVPDAGFEFFEVLPGSAVCRVNFSWLYSLVLMLIKVPVDIAQL